MFEQDKIYCVWKDELDGKMGVVADSIPDLQLAVNNGKRYEVHESTSNDYPFLCDGYEYRYFYLCDNDWIVTIDDNSLWVVNGFSDMTVVARFSSEERATKFRNENIERFDVIRAYFDGKQIECRRAGSSEWSDCETPCWWSDQEYRVKTETVTFLELSEWLAEGNGQYWSDGYIYNHLVYRDGEDNNCVPYFESVRRWGDAEWHIPTREYLCLYTRNVDD